MDKKYPQQDSSHKSSDGMHKQATDRKNQSVGNQRKREHVIVLKHNSGVFLQIGNVPVIDRWIIYKQPTDMGVKKSTMDIVGIFGRIDMGVMKPVIIRPLQGRGLNCQGGKKEI